MQPTVLPLVLISGHSRGLGRALTEHYLARGCRVVGLSRRSLPPHPALRQYALDLSDTAAVSAWMADSLPNELADARDIILINNAAMVAPNALLGRQHPQDIAAAVALNIGAPLLLSNGVLAYRPTAAALRILHISSGAARKDYPGWSVYGATKAALDHHARCVAAEAHPLLKIASIAPGVVDTEMQAEIRQADQQDFPLLPRFEELHRQQALSKPEQVAAALAAYLDADTFGHSAVVDIRDEAV